MAKRKTATKTEPATEPLSDGAKRLIATEGFLMAEAAAEIKAQDCAAFSVLMFNRGDAPEEWQRLGVEAFTKFANFGWTAFHALGGLHVDWQKAMENIGTKLRDGFPKKTPVAKKPKKAN